MLTADPKVHSAIRLGAFLIHPPDPFMCFSQAFILDQCSTIGP